MFSKHLPSDRRPINRLIHSDCFVVMPSLKSNSVDAILTDPPYGIGINTRIKMVRPYRIQDNEDWDLFSGRKDFWQFTSKWIKECVRILRPGGMFISFFDRDQINFLAWYLQKHGCFFRSYFAYIKTNPQPKFNRWPASFEMAVVMQKKGGKGAFNYYKDMNKEYVVSPTFRFRELNSHPTQKPEEVITPIIKCWTNRNDVILDPFCGSGTIPVVAHQLNRRFIGIEKNKQYFEIALKRLKLKP